ncbi:hypothetical protein ACO2Q3_17015 [Caulobacter sp. KR2-114]|uniref:hypothetical protein n=1 Tax=Caulobacter sp. KR2-114 TaxID=3400912 RepID=UPI003C0B674C
MQLICHVVMGLAPGEEHFQACVDSLMRDAQALDRDGDLAAARARCIQSGAAADRPALAECELRGAATAAATASFDAHAGPAAKSYFYASPGEVMRRERMSCARLGLEPAAPGFNSCVQGLQSAMFAADHPQN